LKSSENHLLIFRTLILVGGVSLLLNSCTHVEHDANNARTLKGAGDAAFRKGDYATAKAEYEKALPAARSAGGRELTMLLYSLGDACRRAGDIEQAAQYYRDEIDAAGKSANPEDAIGAWDALYGMYYKAGNFAQAEEAARAELAAVDKYVHDQKDPRVELALSNVIGVACRNGVCKDETELFTRLYENRSARYGATATNTCTARQMLAESYMHKQKYAQAAALYKENVDAFAKVAPNMVPDVSVVYARALMKAGKPKDALAAVANVNGAVGGDAVKLWALRGDAYTAMGDQAKALDAYARMARLGEETWGAKDQQLANYLVRYSEALKRSGRKRDAAALDKQIESVYKDGATGMPAH
jgi:tetratricopeptide (TPR) repeat protein